MLQFKKNIITLMLFGGVVGYLSCENVTFAEATFQLSENGEDLNITVPENETFDLNLTREEFSHVNTINKIGDGNLNIFEIKKGQSLNLEGGENHLKTVHNQNNATFNIVELKKAKLKNTTFTQEGKVIYDELILDNAKIKLDDFTSFNFEKIKKEGENKVVFELNKEGGNFNDNSGRKLNYNFLFTPEDLGLGENKDFVFLNEFNNKDEFVLNRDNRVEIEMNYIDGALDFGDIKFKTTERDQNYDFINNQKYYAEGESKSNPNGSIDVNSTRGSVYTEYPNWEVRINGDNFKEYYGKIVSSYYPVHIINGNLENAELNIFAQGNNNGDLTYLKAGARPVKIFNLKTEGSIIVDIDSDNDYTQYQVKKDVVFYKKKSSNNNEGDLYNTLKINVKDGIKLNKNRFENIISSEDGNVLFYKILGRRDEDNRIVYYKELDEKLFQKVTDNSLLYDFIPEYYDNHIDLKLVKLNEENDDLDEGGSENQEGNSSVDNQNKSKQLEKIIRKRGERLDLLTETNLVPYLDDLLDKVENINVEENDNEENLTQEQRLAKQLKNHFIRIENEEEVEQAVEEFLPIENLLDKKRVLNQFEKIHSFTKQHQLKQGFESFNKLNHCQYNPTKNWYGNIFINKGKLDPSSLNAQNSLKTHDYGLTIGLDKTLDNIGNCAEKQDKLGFNLSVIKGNANNSKTKFENLNFIASIYSNKVLRNYYDIELLSQASLGYSQSKLTNNYHFYQTQSIQKPNYLLGNLSLGLTKEFKLIDSDNIEMVLKPYSFLTYQGLFSLSTQNKTTNEVLNYTIDKDYQQTLSQEVGIMQQFMLKELNKLKLQTGLSLTFDWLNSAKPLYFQHLDKSQHFLNAQHKDKGLKTVKSLKGFVDISYQFNPMTTINSYYQFEKGLKNNYFRNHQVGVNLEIKY